MTLWGHLRAHWRQPLYAFCEWYVFGRDSNWEDVPAPVGVAAEAYRCEHMTVSGQAVRDPSCAACGPMRQMSA